MIEELQTFSTKGNRSNKAGPRRLNASELDALWDEVQALHRNGLGWKPAHTGAQHENDNSSRPRLFAADVSIGADD